MTFAEAKALSVGQIIYSTTSGNRKGEPHRAKITSIKTWKRDPSRIQIKAKHGLYTHLTILEVHLDGWETDESTAKEIFMRDHFGKPVPARTRQVIW